MSQPSIEADKNSKGVVVVVDDDREIRFFAKKVLEKAGFSVTTFGDGESCLAGLAQTVPEAILLDLGLPGMDGLEVLGHIKSLHRLLPVIILTADNTAKTAVTAMHKGAYDYLVKPPDQIKLTTTIQNAVDKYRMSVRLTQLEREVEGLGYPGIVGKSPKMKELFRQMDQIAASDCTVLVHGESGTGKELVVRAIHDNSGRKDKPFVALNCAAIPETLGESEFFGHEKGAFTGANYQRQGAVKEADGGTLFLDEIGELSLPLQGKLLRVIQERSFRRVGGSQDIHTDFRLIAATHRDLSEEVRQGKFREDLYFRIAVFEIEIPPLRQRQQDIPLLARKFVDEFAAATDKTNLEVSVDAMELLMQKSWPGNVRELQNAIQRAVVAAKDNVILPADLPMRLTTSQPDSGSTPSETAPNFVSSPGHESTATMEQIERQSIITALERNHGNISEVVRQLGIGRTTLYRKLKKYGLK